MRTGLRTPAELIETGGWALDDAQARRAADPDTFWLPSDDQLAALAPGASARLIFQLADLADPIIDGVTPYNAEGQPNLVTAHERMWLWIESAGPGPDDDLVGILKNQPVATHTRLVPGARVRFRRRDVIDVADAVPDEMAAELAAMADLGLPALPESDVLAAEDPRRDPTIPPSQAEVCARQGVRPERPYPVPFSRAIVGRALVEGAWPVYGVRFPPNPQRDDTGWSLWAIQPDMDEVSAADGFEVIAVTDLVSRHRLVWNHLALPPGWAFALFEDGTSDIYQDPELLES